MKNVNKQFWNETTEQYAKDYIKTRNPYLWYDYLNAPMTQLANVLITRFAKGFARYYPGTMEDLAAELVTVFSIQMLKWHPSKGQLSVFSWLYTVGKIYIQRLHQIASCQKRDYKLTIYGEDTKTLLLDGVYACDYDYNYYLNKGYTENKYDRLKDPLFILFVCEWWRKHGDNIFNGTIKKLAVKEIISIIQNPQAHTIETHGINQYIAEKVGTGRELVRLVIIKMKHYSPSIIREYEAGSLISDLF